MMTVNDFYDVMNITGTKNYHAIRKSLNYLVIKGIDLSYGYKTGYGRIVILTGKHDEETEIPLINHNVFIKDLEKEPVVVVDLRPYLNTKVKEVEALNDMIRDRSMVDYKVTSAFYMLKLKGKEDSTLNNITYKLISGVLASAVRGNFNIDGDSIVRLQAVLLHFMLSVSKDLKEHEKLEFVKKNILFGRVTIEDLDDMFKDINPTPETTGDLISNINAVDINGSLSIIKEEVFLLAIMGLTNNGIMKKEMLSTIYIPGIAIAMVDVHYNHTFLKKSKFTQLMKAFERSIGLKEASLKIKEEIENGKPE
jgi:hypothetical protein